MLHKINTEKIAWRKINNEIFIISWREKEVSYLLNINEIGSFIWDLLIEGVEEDDLHAKLKDSFEADDEEIKKDIKDFLDSLKNEDLLLLA